MAALSKNVLTEVMTMDLDEVRAMAKKVEGEHQALSNAKARKAQAEDELLEALVEAMKPALPAMCTRMTLSNADADYPAINVNAMVIDAASGLHLEATGSFFRKFANGMGETMQTNEVLDLLDIGTLVATLLAALHAQDGSRVKVTKQIENEALRLESVAALLKPMPKGFDPADRAAREHAAQLLMQYPGRDELTPFKRDNNR